MKIFVVLLAFGLFRLSFCEKLSRGYLPPPGAKYAGGEPGDLQIPFERPKQNPIYKSGFSNAGKEPKLTNSMVSINDNSLKIADQQKPVPTYKSGFEKNIQRPGYQNGLSRTPVVEEQLPIITSENPYGYTETYAVSGSATSIPPVELHTAVENIDGSLSYRYPINGEQLIQKQGQHMKPGSVIVASNDIIQDYRPKAFGMYGGSPMIIRTFTEIPIDSQPVNNLRTNHINSNHPTHDLTTSDEQYGPVSQNTELTATSLTKNKLINAVSPSQQNIAQKTIFKKLERPRGEIDRNAVILTYENVQTPDGYAYNYKTSNGIKMDESATTVDGTKAQGSYSYIGDDGKVYSLSYVADENGFQPSGDHLPTPPPIPEAIQKVIEQALRDKEAGIIHDGSYDEKKYGHMKYEGPINRYLQNVNKNTEEKNRNGVIDEKQNKKPLVNGRIQSKISSERKLNPVNKSRDRFAMRQVQDDQRGVINPINISKTNYYQTSISDNGETNAKFLNKPNKTLYVTHRPADKGSEQVLPSNSEFNDKMGLKFNENGQQNINIFKAAMQNKTSDKVIQPNNAGYYYVPPSKLFIQEKLQGKPKEPPNQYITFEDDNNIDIKLVPQTGFNGIQQNDGFDRLSTKPVQNAGEYLTTADPLSEIDYPKGNIIQDNNLNQSITADERNYFTNVPMQNVKTVPGANFIGDFAVTDFSIRDNTEINNPEDNILPKNTNKNATLSIRNDIAINIYQSTTPLPPRTNTIQILRSNQYETTNAPVDLTDTPFEEQVNEGYLRTTPDVPATFEEFTAPTFEPIFTEGDDTTNIQVDGFGRPIDEIPLRYQNDLEKYNQDINSPQKYDNQPKTEEYFITEAPINIEFENGGVHATDKNTIYYGQPQTGNSINSEPSGSQFTENTSSEPKGTTLRYSDDETIPPGVIGEDFSGPKQPQKFDPETGYYY